MCGIIGFIGNSLKPKTTYYLASALFYASEVRGIDAAGFWAVGDGIYFHKEAVRTSQMIPGIYWHSVKGFNPHLFIGHARAATQGDPKVNKNNQPFISKDQNICLAHNGRVTEYNELKSEYDLESECDSELLLRIFESGQNVAELILEGPTALAVGIARERCLWLFRNQGRPLWLIDVRAKLGQIFFCSTLDIWFHARQGILDEKIYPVAAHEAWKLKLDENIVAERFKIEYS